MSIDSLDTYISSLPRGGASTLASQLGISRVYLSQLRVRQDDREPSPELCVRIETLSGCHVMRWAMRPYDWHLIWPELRAHKDAPAPAAAKAA